MKKLHYFLLPIIFSSFSYASEQKFSGILQQKTCLGIKLPKFKLPKAPKPKSKPKIPKEKPRGETHSSKNREVANSQKETNKKGLKDVYAPNRPLPKTEDGVKVPDTDAPHTQIGKRESKNKPGETYTQAREFDNKGNPVRDLDFTDHGRPNEHPNPHQHRYRENPTGGTSERGKEAEPLPEWNYE